MKKFIAVIGLVFLINCIKVEESTSFKQEYQKEICDKYSLYANTMDVEGSVSLYTKDAIVNGNGRDVVKGADNIRANFVVYYNSSNLLIIVQKLLQLMNSVIRHLHMESGKLIGHLRMVSEPQEKGTGLLIT